ncbi:uncharacterized protein CDAR_617811, partial [Caerostris darwini]
GRKLLAFCNIHELNIENQPDSLPTFSSIRGDSWIDLLLTKNFSSDLVLEVLDEVTNSDHDLLVFSGHLASSTSPNQGKINLGKLKWMDIKTAVSRIMHQDFDIENLTSSEINSLLSKLQDSVFCSLSSKVNPIVQSSSKYKKRRTLISKPICNSVGTPSSNLAESTTNILDFHFPWSNAASVSPSSTSDQEFIPLSCYEVEATVLRIKKKKAVGPDGLPGEIIQEIFFSNRGLFTALLNKLLVLGVFPAVWKVARVVLLNKDNKELNHPSHFRPICILPCWGKVLDKIICDRLSYYLEANKLLNIKQFGFRKNKSTILAIKNILDFHNTSREEKNITLLVSIDMSNAFNAVDWGKMKAKIFALPIPHYLKAIVCDFLQDRQVILHGISRPYNR